ncbi:MAG TPA: ATP-binding protein [Terriglobales bacterium]|nr:ATP-binding protein [Terriglobales bacterium]
MSFRRKLLATFALTVFFAVAGVAIAVSVLTRRAFEKSESERTSALITQFQREFAKHGEDVVRRIETIAATDSVAHIALDANRAAPDLSAYVNEAKPLADSEQLDFLELVTGDGAIISSAQSPAKFGYKESLVTNLPAAATTAFLKREELSDGTAVFGVFSLRALRVGDKPVYVIGGQRLDSNFLATLPLTPGARVMLYPNLASDYSPKLLVDASGPVAQAEMLRPLLRKVQQTGVEQDGVVRWSADAADVEDVHAMPLKGQKGELLGVLLIGNSRRSLVELERRIRSAALLIGSLGLVLAMLVSSWAATRVTRPVEQLAAAARQVADGNWDAKVELVSDNELGHLAEAFNRMTRELIDQRERLIQSERVAAWRELARRLAHELKNPLFPLQITVENLLKAHESDPDQFEEVFRESTGTLLAEIANLKTITGRFSDFSRMPQPRLQPVKLNEIVRSVLQLYQNQLNQRGQAIVCNLNLDESVGNITADPDLLHRALSNLVVNAIDAMPGGGTLSIRTQQKNDEVHIEVSDTGEGLSPEECKRLFTPYYTTKEHGTGLGLAIVQSVVSDHHGRITVSSTPGRGTTFLVALPSGSALAGQAALSKAEPT